MNWNTPVDFNRFRAQATLTGLGFRVVAPGHNHTSSLARAPGLDPTLWTVWNHLNPSLQQATPWVSLTRSWRAALRRRQRFLDDGAQHVYIVVVDIERMAQNMLSASALASQLPYQNPQLCRHEYLIWRGISSDAIVSVLPATGRGTEINIWLGKIEIPSVICDEAGGRTPQHIYNWVAEELCRTMGYRDLDMTLRLIQSMCVQRDDYSLV